MGKTKRKNQGRRRKARRSAAREFIKGFKRLFASNKKLLGVYLLRLRVSDGTSDIFAIDRSRTNDRDLKDLLASDPQDVHVAAICHEYSDTFAVKLQPDAIRQLEGWTPEAAHNFYLWVIEQFNEFFEARSERAPAIMWPSAADGWVN